MTDPDGQPEAEAAVRERYVKGEAGFTAAMLDAIPDEEEM
jgi:hypothetical protein